MYSSNAAYRAVNGPRASYSATSTTQKTGSSVELVLHALGSKLPPPIAWDAFHHATFPCPRSSMRGRCASWVTPLVHRRRDALKHPAM